MDLQSILLFTFCSAPKIRRKSYFLSHCGGNATRNYKLLPNINGDPVLNNYRSRTFDNVGKLSTREQSFKVNAAQNLNFLIFQLFWVTLSRYKHKIIWQTENMLKHKPMFVRLSLLFVGVFFYLSLIFEGVSSFSDNLACQSIILTRIAQASYQT